ncbi:MAG TPA: GFA family protein [Polyangiales bacterium]|jgi:hypothetical protein|nr:GFA family protein [Polyangiales bacterium]
MESRTYSGSCHCGKVRYEATTDLSNVIECNCSICSRAGYLLGFVPGDNFKLLSGEDSLSSYHFNKMKIDHKFCKNCGVRSFGQAKGKDGQPMYAINVRCLEGVDPKSLQIKQVDGKSI